MQNHHYPTGQQASDSGEEEAHTHKQKREVNEPHNAVHIYVRQECRRDRKKETIKMVITLLRYLCVCVRCLFPRSLLIFLLKHIERGCVFSLSILVVPKAHSES